MRLSRTILLLMLATTLPVQSAFALDVHNLWDDRCQECHGHAGAFARAYLHA